MKPEERIDMTSRDRLMRSWHNSMELVRDYQAYAEEIKGDKQLSLVFREFADDEAMHAAKFRELLHQYTN